MASLRYGAVQIVVTDSKVTYVEVSKRTRFAAPWEGAGEPPSGAPLSTSGKRPSL